MKKQFLISIICILCLILFGLLSTTFNKKPEKKYNVKATDEILLMLVNYNHQINDDFDPLLIEYDGFMLSKYLYNDFIDMKNDLKKNGYSLEITSSYRSYSEQEDIYNKKYNYYIDLGTSKEDAKYLTEKEVAVPGYSEHETGLAIDLSAMGELDEKEKMWNYLNDNSYKYGFINRYPENKQDITKIKYEPWHFRYVGKKYAKEIYDSGLCLEEYLIMKENSK